MHAHPRAIIFKALFFPIKTACGFLCYLYSPGSLWLFARGGAGKQPEAAMEHAGWLPCSWVIPADTFFPSF